MKILEYDQVDPLGVLELNFLSLNYALTPERAALIRHLDPRPCSFFGVYAVEEGVVAGQVLVYRLTMVSMEGIEHVGGMCAVCTHPAFSRRGIAGRLFEEAHERMRKAGLRFSTLGTARHRGAYDFYLRQGYEDVFTDDFTFMRSASLQPESLLRAEPAGAHGIPLADEFFPRIAKNRLGFAIRSPGHLGVIAQCGDLATDSLWLLRADGEMAGYALANVTENILAVDDLLLAEGIEPAGAIAAIASKSGASYIQVRINHPATSASLRRAGYPAALPGWGTFMIKSLHPALTVDDARRLFGIGTERFLISPLDVT